MEYLLLETRGPVAVVTINRPQALNALCSALLEELRETFGAMARDEAVRAVVLTGAGKAFVAGADIAEMRGFTPEEANAYAARGAQAFAAVETLPQPVIAAVNGYALGGGCELALACDIRLASEKARFGQPEVGLGITPGFGGTQRLPRAIGAGLALEMILSARPIDAHQALAVGLVNAVYAPEALLEEAVRLAETIARNAPVAVRAAKRAVHLHARRALDEDIAGEGRLFAQCFATEDQKEAMAAFVEKRTPAPFQGR